MLPAIHSQNWDALQRAANFVDQNIPVHVGLSSLGIVKGIKPRAGWFMPAESFPVAALGPNWFISHPTVIPNTPICVSLQRTAPHTFHRPTASSTHTAQFFNTNVFVRSQWLQVPYTNAFWQGIFFLHSTCWKRHFSVKRNLTASRPTHLKRQKEISIELWK